MPALAISIALSIPMPGLAQETGEATVESRLPRTVGYFVGDRLDYAGTITVPDGFDIDLASRPRPRDLDYWLELQRVSIEPARKGSGRRFEVMLGYQTFYVPLEPRELRIPPVTIGFRRQEDGARIEATLPGFSFISSPLRPILERSSPQAMRPDAALVVGDTRPAQWRTGIAVGASLALFGMLAAYRGWLPTGRRRPRPLGLAARHIAGLRPQTSRDAYRAALLELHRGLDAAAGRRLLADDLANLLREHPRFAEAAADLGRFFAASRLLYFSDDPAGAAAALPARDIVLLAGLLAAIERAP
ncbi:hypothetical protein Sa4125_26980 [Aureimonas sp. SA4125]|uniref:nonribosomal peptide synthetase MxaA n=1 Tax=Aureimonas sp. SA4125 TaxID=2826993 RepID=UPI001CC7DACB|nr:nonribosomal peptide synthetase MxaA [Aureimonas sp. SA4125]BDA85156.1 hypothetical protein Sa4125_26980 [Aureimonas sp. SA4125]